MNRHLLIGSAWPPSLVERLQGALAGWRVTPFSEATTEDRRAASVLVPLHLRVDRDLVAGSELRLIHQFGVGLDNVDLAAMKTLGVAVANSPSEISGMAATVAEGAMLLVLSCARLPSQRANNLASGVWNWTTPLNLGLAGRSAGLVGFGAIGRAIARRLLAFDMNVAAVRRTPAAAGEAERLGLEWIAPLEHLGGLVERSDVIVICAPLTEETNGLFDADLIRRMKPGASLVNVGRGGIVDEAALLAALDTGRLHAAGLDTVSAEPPEADSRLLSHPRLVLTPHDAGVSDTAFDGVVAIIRENLRRLEGGESFLNRVV